METMTGNSYGKLFASLCLLVVTVALETPTQNEDIRRTEQYPVEEYCAGETFHPRCLGGQQEVIVILAARYGRMRTGRCVKDERPRGGSVPEDPLFLGCSADVKHTLDHLCSGRSECTVFAVDHTFAGVEPCYTYLKLYMEVSYTCLKVAAESRHCTVPLTTEPQHIVGGGRSRQVQTDTVGCGTESQPWSIEALSGQRIAVGLIDFIPSGPETSTLRSYQSSDCIPLYGQIVDKTGRKNVNICRRQADVQNSQAAYNSIIYRSSSNQIHIKLNDVADRKFIVRLEAVGCSDLAPPSDSAWLKRVDDQITVGCYMSRQSWKLSCVNGVWTGTVGVCSDTGIDETDEKDSRQTLPTSKKQSKFEMAALAGVVSAGGALCCLVICIGVFCLRRQRMNAYHEKTTKTLSQPVEFLQS